MSNCGEHALVIGASLGGLLAARVLSESYARVTVVERDELPDSEAARRGAPQGRHAHGLLASGARTLERLFPGFFDDVVAAGGKVSDIAHDCRWHNFGGALKAHHSDLEGFLISRPTMENLIRRRVRALPNIAVLDRRDVIGLDYAAGRVTGLRHKAAGVNEPPQAIAADLVVDASGRGGRALFWLEELGYEKPREERVEVDIAYTTRHFRRSARDLPGLDAVILAANPQNWRPSVVLAQEGDRWCVTLGGYFGERAPDDLEGFLAYARSLPSPEIYNAIRDAEPIGEAATYAFKASLRRRYEKLEKFPEGYLPFGDALASFNPVYGQGMSVAAAEALALRGCLEKGTRNLRRRFFAAAAAVIDTPWSMAVGADLAHPQTKGKRTAAVNFINGYIAKVFAAGQTDERVARAFLDVANLIAPPPSLFHPAILWRVLRAQGKPGGERRRPAPAYPA